MGASTLTLFEDKRFASEDKHADENEALVAKLVPLGLVVFCWSRPRAELQFPKPQSDHARYLPFVKLTEFRWDNFTEKRTYASKQEFKFAWTNIGDQALVAFEIVTLKYDPFDRPMLGSRMTVTGRSSADYRPLPPGQSSSDGFYGYGHTDTFTGIAYVRSARLADGTVWQIDEAQLKAAIKKALPTLREYGPLVPETKTEKQPEKAI